MNTYKIYLQGAGKDADPFYYCMVEAGGLKEAETIGKAVAKYRMLNFAFAQIAVNISIEKSNEKKLITGLESSIKGLLDQRQETARLLKLLNEILGVYDESI